MKASEAQALIEGFQQLVGKLVDNAGMGSFGPAKREVVANGIGSRLVRPGAAPDTAKDAGAAPASKIAIIDEWKHDRALEDFEWLYQKIKNRFIDEARIDPILLKLIQQQNEIVVEIEPRVVTLDGTTTRGRVARLMADGWFNDPRSTSAVRKELARTGSDPGGGGGLGQILNEFKRDGFLVDVSGQFQFATGVKVTTKELTVV